MKTSDKIAAGIESLPLRQFHFQGTSNLPTTIPFTWLRWNRKPRHLTNSLRLPASAERLIQLDVALQLRIPGRC